MKTLSALILILSGASLAHAAPQEMKPQQERPAPPKPANEFNPTITVFHDMLWRLDNKHVREIEDGVVITKSDKFLLRETELDLRASIDPYADGVFILAVEQEVPGAFEVDAEEAYVRIKSLPFGFWEEPPLGTRIKVGRFLPSIGRQNRLHTHDLPQPQRGLAYEQFVGDHPYIANGASADMILPADLNLTVEALQGGGWDLAANGIDGRPAYIANLSWFNTFGDEHDVEISLIGYYGHNDEERRRHVHFYGLDFLYKWKPARAGEWRSIVIAGQLFYGVQEFLIDLDGDGDNVREPGVDLDLDGNIDDRIEDRHRAFGWFVYGQYQLDRRWYAGIRYDWTQYLEDRPFKDDEASRITPYISCYISEFFRLRVAYEFTQSDIHEDDDLHTFLFELAAVFGSHPPHPYWVNQ